MYKEESRTDLGILKIHKNVIASIASLASMEIDGVKGIGKNFKAGILEFLGKGIATAIKVDIDKNEGVKIEVPIIVRYGYNIPEIASRVQENVRLNLEKMTDLSVKDININIVSIEK